MTFTKNAYGKTNQTLDTYIQEICKYDLLTADEEKELAKQIKQGSKEALDELVNANLRYVINVANQYKYQGMLIEDLICEGNLGLIEAARRFDGEKGFKFISYAVWWIRQSILQALSKQSRITKIPFNRIAIIHKMKKMESKLGQELGFEPSIDEIADELEMNVSEIEEAVRISYPNLLLDSFIDDDKNRRFIDIMEDESQPPPDTEFYKKLLQEEIEKVLLTLPDREAEIIRLYYGLGEGNNAITLKEIGVKYKLTRERVRQIKLIAIKKLQRVSRSKPLKDYV